MSEINKTKGICIKKMDFGDTSKIATLYTAKYGKISVIIKSGRQKNSKIGAIVDIFNLIEIVYYNKNSRTVQLLTQADLIDYYPNIKSDINLLKYATAILELFNELIHEGEANALLFSGLQKILKLIDLKEDEPKLLFVKFCLFFIKELGYEIDFGTCSICNNKIVSENGLFDLNNGTVCNDCFKDSDIPINISKELFYFCKSLNNTNKVNNTKNLDLIITYLLRYLKRNIPEFRGLLSLQIY
ncbi:MAG TPA: DNA repair protein RecO [Melioribacteraceae bacterium]|nr:DNA repair protein RecO [Melioribacteraceae bacterium]